MFLVRGEVIHTPPIGAGILIGVTRNAVIGLARDLGYQVIEEYFTSSFVHMADEMFLTGTAAEVIPVVEVDARPIGTGRPGPITARLIEAFHNLAQTTGTAI